MTAVGVELVHGTDGYCSACGTVIFAWRPRILIGARNYCGPVGSACHKSGLLSGRWSFSEADAAALLAADIARLRRVGARTVDPVGADAPLGERVEHAAA